jgi:bacilysin biosynthesis oxidoreductase BacG
MSDERRVALIVGGSGGIGLATALLLVEQGCRVVIASREGSKLTSARETLKAIQPDSLAIAADVTDPEARRRLFERLDAECGRLDILVNSVPGAEPASFIQHGVAHIEDGITKKLIPYLDCMKQGFERMKARRWGRIVNVVGNMWKEPDPVRFNFGLVNAAIVNASKAASVELAPYGITVNGVHPGSILTDRLKSVWTNAAEKQGLTMAEMEQRASADIPAGRIGSPEEAAALIAFLVSTPAGYITGQQISVDGGLMRSI